MVRAQTPGCILVVEPLWISFKLIVLFGNCFMVSVSRGFIDKDNYMKSYISAGDFLSKKHFKSHYAGDRERNVC